MKMRSILGTALLTPILAAALSVASSLATTANAYEIDIDVSDKSVRLGGGWSVAPRMVVDVGWFHHVDNGSVAHVGLQLRDFATGGPSPIQAGLGGRAVYYQSSASNDRGLGLALGGDFQLNIPSANRFQIGGSLYYAPQVLSFNGGTEYSEIRLYVGYEILRQGAVYLGYRIIRAEFDSSPDAELDKGIHIGLRLRF